MAYVFEVHDSISDHLCNDASVFPFQNTKLITVAAPDACDQETLRAIPTRRSGVDIEAPNAHLDNWHDRVRWPWPLVQLLLEAW
jgi:hypothetical protein